MIEDVCDAIDDSVRTEILLEGHSYKREQEVYLASSLRPSKKIARISQTHERSCKQLLMRINR